jgi:hypothetical protein
MTTAELVNLIIRKFGGNRVTFEDIYQFDNDEFEIGFILGGNSYRVYYKERSYRKHGTVLVKRCEVEGRFLKEFEDNYSRWVEGVLNGMVRDEEGNLVKS